MTHHSRTAGLAREGGSPSAKPLREHDRADAVERRQEEVRRTFLRSATRLLASTLDYEKAVATLAQLAVPKIADFCAVDLLDEDGAIERLAIAHVDPKMVALARELYRLYPPALDAPFGVPKVLRSGEPELVHEIPDELLASVVKDEEQLRITRELGLRSYMIVPIRNAERVVGAVSFVTTRASRVLTEADLRLCEQLCDWAGIAIENARLYRNVLSARADAEEASARTAKLQLITASLAGAQSLDEIGTIAMGEAFSHLGAAASVLYVREGAALRLLAHRGLGSPSLLEILPVDTPLPLGHAVRERSPVWAESYDELIARYPGLVSASTPASRLQSVAALPLLVHGAVVGGLAFSFAEPRSFKPADRDMLGALAGQIAQSIDRAQLRAAEQSARQRLAENEGRYRYIFEAAAVGIAEKDYTSVKQKLDALAREGVTDFRAHFAAHPELVEEAIDLVRVRDVNVAMMRLFGASEKSELASLRPIFLPEARSLFVDELVALIEGTKTVVGEMTMQTLHGGRIEVLATIVFPPSGFDRVLVSRTDITEQKRMLAERESLVGRLQDTVRLSELFAGILGHDLRNPLAAVLMGSQVLLRRVEGESAVRIVQRILSSGERMSRMIEQLLDFTRARVGGGMVILRRDLDVRQLCAEILAEVAAAHPHCVLRFEHSGDTQGSWDADRLAQVVSNLASNACQHGAQSAPIVVEVDGTSTHAVVLSVSNEGEIPPEVLSVLFDPFRKAHDRRQSERLGLGLFITQQIVLSHGGSIDVHSARGKTTFVAKLPRR